jgi:hypothetical protein
MLRRTSAALAVAIGMLAAPLAVEAAPTPKERVQASTAWTAGKRLVLQKKLDDAVASFRRAYELDPKAQYQLDLARALSATKSLVEAQQLCEAIAASSEPNIQRVKTAAATLKTDLDARVPTIQVEVIGPGAASALVTIDGETVRVGKDLPYDPGPHVVKARTGDAPEVSEQLDLGESQHRVVSLTLGKAVADKPVEESGSSDGNMAPAAVLYGVGGAALIAGGVLGGLAFKQTSDTEDLCGGKTCPPQYADDIALAQDYGTASTVLFAVGGLGVAAAVILTFTVGLDSSDDEEKKDEKAAFIEPVFGPGFLGARGAF